MEEQDRLDENETQPATSAADTSVLELSFSQIEAFTMCPQRWWLTKRGNVRRAPGEFLILGSAVHQTIEADLRQRMANQPPLGLDALKQMFSAFLREQFALEDPDGIIPSARRAERERDGIAVVIAYLAEIAPHIRPVAVEIPFEFAHPDDPSILFRGRMDAITFRSRTRTIVDWKIVRRAWPPGEEHRKMQAAAYLWAEACMGWELSNQVTFITFPPDWSPEPGDSVRRVDWRPTKPSAEKRQMYAQLVREAAAAIRAMEAQGDFQARPSPRCAWCEVRGACPAGERYLAENNIPPQMPSIT